ncbi:MAG: hypothetical protein M3Q23_01575 [Actinomycetota bacterium]|nr:hypothetical protein [Actinomycetota bacterium]
MKLFARWRAARAEDPCGERGQLGPLEGILIVGTAALLGLGLGAAINYAQNELSGPGKPPPIRPIELATFGAVPDNDCGKRVLGLFSGTVTYDKGIWSAPDTPTPKLAFQPDEADIKKYNKEVTFWNDLMKSRVGAVLKEVKEQGCDKPPEPIQNPGTKGPGGDNGFIFGTYSLSPTVTPNPECKGVLPPSLTVSSGASATEITLTVASNGDIPGKTFSNLPLSGGPGFRADAPDLHWSIDGTFIQRSSGTIVQGTFLYNIGGGCGVTYEGTAGH